MENLSQAGQNGGANILIVDDTPDNLRVLSGVLKERGYKVRPAPNGDVALRAAECEPPDLILLDIMMPGMDGYEVCRRLKSDPRLRDIAIIFVSSLHETFDKVKAFGSGGVDYITKPFQFEEVLARVETHLTIRRMQQKLSEQNRRLQESFEALRRLQELRENLTNMLAQDMRGPLVTIESHLELLERLQGPRLDEKGRDYVSKSRQAIAGLIEKADSLLDLARLEGDQLPEWFKSA